MEALLMPCVPADVCYAPLPYSPSSTVRTAPQTSHVVSLAGTVPVGYGEGDFARTLSHGGRPGPRDAEIFEEIPIASFNEHLTVPDRNAALET